MNNGTRLLRRLSYSIPYICLALGALVLLVYQNIWMIGGGLLCISSSTMVLLARNKKSKARRDGLIDTRNAASGARKLVWNSALECGIKAIDVQHRTLFEAGNALLASVHNKKSGLEATSKVHTLIDEVERHFESEESLLAAWNHPLTDDHKAVHESLLAKANQLLARSKNGTLSYQCAFNFLVDDLVYGHIVSEDQKFVFPT